MEQKSELAKLIEPLGKFFADGVHAGEQKGKFWAAKWVEDHAKGASPEVVQFAETVVMSIRASCEMVCLDCGHYCTYTHERMAQGQGCPMCKGDTCCCGYCYRHIAEIRLKASLVTAEALLELDQDEDYISA